MKNEKITINLSELRYYLCYAKKATLDKYVDDGTAAHELRGRTSREKRRLVLCFGRIFRCCGTVSESLFADASQGPYGAWATGAENGRVLPPHQLFGKGCCRL